MKINPGVQSRVPLRVVVFNRIQIQTFKIKIRSGSGRQEKIPNPGLTVEKFEIKKITINYYFDIRKPRIRIMIRPLKNNRIRIRNPDLNQMNTDPYYNCSHSRHLTKKIFNLQISHRTDWQGYDSEMRSTALNVNTTTIIQHSRGYIVHAHTPTS